MVLLLLMPGLPSQINHGLDLLCVQGEEDITEPLLVDPVPVPLVRHVLEQLWLSLCHLDEVIQSETLIEGDCCHLDVVPL